MPEISESLELQIASRLKQIKMQYLNSREDLLPEISESDYLKRTEVADKKSKVGVAFGSNLQKRFAKNVPVSGAIVCRLYTISVGGWSRNDVQTAWAKRLNDFYKNLFEGLEDRNIIEETYSSTLTSILASIEKALQILQESRTRASSTGGDPRTVKGFTLLALIPDPLKMRFIMDITDAYLARPTKTQQQDIARFLVLQDHFPYIWKAPRGASIAPVEEGRAASQVFQTKRDLRLDWDSESSKEKYFPSAMWEPDKDESGSIITETVSKAVIREGEIEYEQEEIPVYSLRRDQDYVKQIQELEDKINDFQEYSQLTASERFVKDEAEKQASRTEKFVKRYAKIVFDKFGAFVRKGEKGVTPQFAGKLFYRICLQTPQLVPVVERVQQLTEQLMKAPKEEKETLKQEWLSYIRSNLLSSDVDTQTVTQLASQIAGLFTLAKNNPILNRIASGDLPENTYDPDIYDQKIYPANQNYVTLQSTYDEKPLSIKVPAKKNPFYTPRMWPAGFERGGFDWPGRGTKGLGGSGVMLTEWRNLPWATLSLEEKRNNIQRMKDQLGETQGAEAVKLRRDIQIVEKALFYDELSAFVKINLAFNVDDPSNPSVVSKMEDAPPLFYLKSGEEQVPVSLSDLVDKEGLSAIKQIYGADFLDIATDEAMNYGMLHEQPEFINEILKRQLRANLSLVSRLQRLAQVLEGDSKEMFFDLEGNSYPTEQALTQHLVQQGDLYTIEQKVESANAIVEVANKLLRTDNSFVKFLDILIEELESLHMEKTEQIEENLPAEIDKEEDEIPELDFEPQLQIQPQQEQEETYPLAASRCVKKFTRG